MERALRKIKPFLDPQEKLKHRYAALQQFLEAAPGETDRAAFFREHRVALFEYALLSFRAFQEKLSRGTSY